MIDLGIQMKNFLLGRESTREYSSRKVSRRQINKIEEVMKELDSQGVKKYFSFLLFKDGDRIFQGLKGHGGYEGFMIESPHYIGIRLEELSGEAVIKSAYATEKLITELTDLDLGSCWITLKGVDSKIKKEVLGQENTNIDYLIAFGNTKLSNPFETVKSEKSSRMSIEELVFDGELGKPICLKELEHRGLEEVFYYIRFAPSTLNSQPWRFVLKAHSVDLYLCKIENQFNLIDAGIVMYYFKELAVYSGIRSDWEVIPTVNTIDYNKECIKIAEITL